VERLETEREAESTFRAVKSANPRLKYMQSGLTLEWLPENIESMGKYTNTPEIEETKGKGSI
jgi:hypothetical protein